MTHHVIREESNHVVLPRLGAPMPPPTPAQREVLRLLGLGRHVTVVDTKARSWTVSRRFGSSATDNIAAIHAELLARAKEADQ